MKMELLEDLYKRKLAELLDGEKQLLQFLPKMAKVVTSEELRRLLNRHLEETKEQCRRLEQLVATRGVEEAKASKAMSGILSESEELLQQQESADPDILTLALASAAEDVEGHEITGYACAHTYAKLLGFHEDLRPLEQTFQEEKNMEDELVALAEGLGIEEAESETPIEHAKSGKR